MREGVATVVTRSISYSLIFRYAGLLVTKERSLELGWRKPRWRVGHDPPYRSITVQAALVRAQGNSNSNCILLNHTDIPDSSGWDILGVP